MVQLKRRASSVPPRLGRAGPEPVCPAQEQEVEDGLYVQSLQKKLAPVFACEVELQSNASTEEPMVGHVPSDIPSEWDASPKEGKPKCNPGSAGHPELCRRPCIYFALGKCSNEADCNFCHLSHSNRSATLDKSQRQLIKEMSQHEFLSMVLRCLQSKAAEGQFELDAEDVLQLFQVQIAQMRATSSKVAKTKVMNLERALSRMTFFSIASLTSRMNLSASFLDACKEKVGELRQRLA